MESVSRSDLEISDRPPSPPREANIIPLEPHLRLAERMARLAPMSTPAQPVEAPPAEGTMAPLDVDASIVSAERIAKLLHEQRVLIGQILEEPAGVASPPQEQWKKPSTEAAPATTQMIQSDGSARATGAARNQPVFDVDDERPPMIITRAQATQASGIVEFAEPSRGSKIGFGVGFCMALMAGGAAWMVLTAG